MRIGIVSADRSDANGNAWNLGDAFLTDVLKRELEARGHKVRALDLGGDRTDGLSDRVSAEGLVGLLEFVKGSDAVVVGGGTMLQDDARDRLFGGLPRLCAAVRLSASIQRKPIAFFGVGCDPVSRRSALLLLKVATRGVPVWVREPDSLARAADTLGAPALLAGDACLLPASPRPTITDDVGVTFALNFNDERQLTSSLVERARAVGSVRVLGMSQGDSLTDVGPWSEQAVGPRSEQATDATREIVPYPATWEQAFNTIASSRIVVASRMHALYMALLAGTPVIALSTNAKLQSFASEFHVPTVSSLADIRFGSAREASAQAVTAARARASAALDLLETQLAAKHRPSRTVAD